MKPQDPRQLGLEGLGQPASAPPDAPATAVTLGTGPSAGALEAAAALLEASPDYRVLRRFVPREVYAEPAAEAEIARAAIVDTETTGTDVAADAVIELAVVVRTRAARSRRNPPPCTASPTRWSRASGSTRGASPRCSLACSG
jgi:hypothetical protein